MQQLCEAFPVCLVSRSLYCGSIPHVALRLYDWVFSIPFFFCIVMECAQWQDQIASAHWGREINVCALCGWNLKMPPYLQVKPCWRRESGRNVSKLKHCSKTPISLLIWANILNLSSHCLLSGGLSGWSLIFPVCIFAAITGYLVPVRYLLYCLPELQAAFSVHVSWGLQRIWQFSRVLDPFSDRGQCAGTAHKHYKWV